MTIGFAGCTRNPSGGDEAQLRKEVVLECHLETKGDGKDVLVNVVFKNPTDHRELVPKDVILDEQPLGGPPFVVTRNGDNVPYTGMMINKAPPSKEKQPSSSKPR